MLKVTTIAENASSGDLLFWLYDNMSASINIEEQAGNPGSPLALDQSTLAGAVNSFSEFFEKFPFSYSYYFKMPFLIPDEITIIELSPKAQIIRPSDPKFECGSIFEPRSKLAAAVMGINQSFKKEDVFLNIKVSGFGDFSNRRAMTKLKQFLYIGHSFSAMTRKYGRLYTSGPATAPFTTTLPKRMGVNFYPIPFHVSEYLSRHQIDQRYILENNRTTLLGLYPQNPSDPEVFIRSFKLAFRDFIKLEDYIDDPERGYIRSAIEWGFDGQANDNETVGFIQVCIGLESILGDREEDRQVGLSARLADRCAHILGTSPQDRRALTEKFKNIYKARSRLVHGSQLRMSEADGALFHEAKLLLGRLVVRELHLSPIYPSGLSVGLGMGLLTIPPQ